MDLRNYQITVGEVLRNPQAKEILQKELPMVMRHPMLPLANAIPLKDFVNNIGDHVSFKKMQSILDQLSKI